MYKTRKKKHISTKDDFKLPKEHRTPVRYGEYLTPSKEEVEEEQGRLDDYIESFRIKESLKEDTLEDLLGGMGSIPEDLIPSPRARGTRTRTRTGYGHKKGGKIDNSGQQYVAKQYGGKVK